MTVDDNIEMAVSYTHLDVYKRQPRTRQTPLLAAASDEACNKR